MSKAVSALQGASFHGFAEVTEQGLVGMVTLKADLEAPETMSALQSVTGATVPARRAMTGEEGGTQVAWMAPDEVLILCDHAKADQIVADLSAELGAAHHLAVNVSDARAVFCVKGAGAREVLGKLTPADLGGLPAREMRRSRLAQVPGAFWFNEAGDATIICFRSVAQYAFDLLANAATPGSEVGYH
ncbi:sarcosine oxidase subunit gamma [Gymnodinialimonas ceratoperidinii]|uniref:Sarcosine oxidase subunit gamma n=1 Tax=Gymnodinialimonas ceratoperidinii TaxID=2856823 RepID=A0A8F6Y978_9RHOB|nr:sarcosine oxidase subunit gamma family protein [Gymnodinialimonas ceratoperidinii]QXT38303.1 sarcosine oxidase subunit gamma [Gymnodinialimonas ceratoperidinii]